MKRLASSYSRPALRGFASSSSSSVLTSSSSAAGAQTLTIPLRRRFATQDQQDQQQTQQNQQQQQDGGSGGGGGRWKTNLMALGAGMAVGYAAMQIFGIGAGSDGNKGNEAHAAERSSSSSSSSSSSASSSSSTSSGQHPVALNKDEFRAFEVVEVEDLTPNTRRVRFALPTADHVLGLPIASCVVTRANIGENGKPVIRPYTPVSNDKVDKGYFDFVVKTYPTGVMSSHIYNLKVGEKLEVKGPIPKLPYTKNMKKHIGMLAGGTGITPMLQVVEEVLSEKDDKTRVSLIFANNSEEDIILKDRLDQLAKKHPNFEVHYVVLKPNSSSWKGHTGYITPDIIKKHIPGPSEDVMVLVCGPPPFYNALSGPKAPDYSQGELAGVLKDLGYTKEQVFKF